MEKGAGMKSKIFGIGKKIGNGILMEYLPFTARGSTLPICNILNNTARNGFISSVFTEN